MSPVEDKRGNASENIREDRAGTWSSLDQILSLPLRALRVPLYSNAFFLMAEAGGSAVLGAAFWLVAARYYPAREVGLAAAVIPLVSFLASVATLGLGFGLIRFLPESLDNPRRARRIINTSLTISGALGALLGLVFLAGVEWWTPRLAFLRADPLITLGFVLLSALIAFRAIETHVFVAIRQVQYSLASSLLTGIRVVLAFFLIGLGGSMGLVISYGAGILLAAVAGAFLFLPLLVSGYRPSPSFRLNLLKRMAGFSVGNHAASLIARLLPALLPVMALELRSPQENAWFYIAWFLGNLLYAIPGSLSTSLFAEGSQVEVNLLRDVRRTVLGALALLTPAATILWFGGDWILGLFGESYAVGGFGLLRWLVLASPLVLFNHIYATIVRIEGRVVPVVAGATFISSFTLVASFLLLPAHGLEVIGISFLLARSLFAVVAAADLLKGRWERVVFRSV